MADSFSSPTADPLSMLEHGMHLAGKGIGLLRSQGLFAQMIGSLTSAVKRTKQPVDRIDLTGPVSGILDRLLSMLRLDSNSKLQAVALNAVVFIAQMIDNSLAMNAEKLLGKDKTRTQSDDSEQRTPDGSPLNWVLQDMPQHVKEDLILSRQETLPEEIMSKLEENPAVGNCIKHLVCRLSPVIWGMQKATNNLFLNKEWIFDNIEETSDQIIRSNQNPKKTPLQLMFSELPTIEQYTEHMKYCQKTLPPCVSRK
ncbi:uncharacterized protein LOC111048524 [Nilaparvata lugens]|uniref:uncharacterized protein LOC111048524 n=1 Tax=Nilaparvata lugens TaxID=108931 RepID=UPI00193CE768|nr:uncharacterized protein LOC111048524 [Nilaparvata lugens]